MPTDAFAGYTPTWCSGCGNWSIGRAISKSLTDQGHSPSSVAVVFDIGCSGNMNDFINAYAMHTLHGRALATGVGIALANHDLPVLITGGDGALLGEGGNHFMHACRGNHNLTVVIHDNSIYGLTTGQVSPTSQQGSKSKSTPYGIIEHPLNPLALALTQGATFVAQAFSAQLPQLSQLITQGMQHKGLSVINVLQPCVTFNKVNTYGYYIKNTYKLENHDTSNFDQALQKAMEPTHEKFPLGVLYQVERPTYQDQLDVLSNGPLVTQDHHTEMNPLITAFV